MEKVNVAPSSTEGHFVQTKKENVVMLDEVTEAFLIKEDSKLVTKNHTDLTLEAESLIVCQTIYNPYSKLYEKSRD
jgi:hypothetical protein